LNNIIIYQQLNIGHIYMSIFGYIMYHHHKRCIPHSHVYIHTSYVNQGKIYIVVVCFVCYIWNHVIWMGCPIVIAPYAMHESILQSTIPTHKFHYMGKSSTHTSPICTQTSLQVYIYIYKPRECIHNSTYVFFVIFIILYDYW
jgi:hypothetical protein